MWQFLPVKYYSHCFLCIFGTNLILANPTGSVTQTVQPVFRTPFQRFCLRGWEATACSSTPQTEPIVDACTRLSPYRSVSVPTTLRLSAPFETSASTWTLMHPWRHTPHELLKVVSASCASCGASRGLRSLPRHAVVSLVTSLVLTKLDYCSRSAFLQSSWTDSRPSSTQQFVLSVMLWRQITLYPCWKIYTGYESRKGSSTSYVTVCVNIVISQAPTYLYDQLQQVARMEPRQRLRSQEFTSARRTGDYSRRWVTDRFLSLPPGRGTVCRQQSMLCLPCIHFTEPWNLIFPTILVILSAFWANMFLTMLGDLAVFWR